MSSHANPDLFGKPGYQQPRGFRPLVRDDSLPHQIRLFHELGQLKVSCQCLKTESEKGARGYFTSPAHWLQSEPVVDAIEALAWYRTHLARLEIAMQQLATTEDFTLSDDVSSSNVARIDVEG